MAMKAGPKTLLAAMAAVLLVGALAFLVSRTRVINYEQHSSLIAELRSLKAVDAEWNADVLRSRMNLNLNFDPVASALPMIDRLQTQINERQQSYVLQDPHANQIASETLTQLGQAMREKTDMIESFKSQNAILRNAIRYLPIAVQHLADDLDCTVNVPATLYTDLRIALEHLVALTMNYTINPDTESREAIQTTSDLIRSRSAKVSRAFADRTRAMLQHAVTLVTQQDRGDDLLKALTTVPTAARIDAVAQAYDQLQQRGIEQQENYSRALAWYSTALLLGLAWVGWRLSRTWRLLNDSNASLAAANKEIKESQVYLVQSEKMSALGQMVAGIAHEINTPLAYVKGTISLLGEQIASVRELALESRTLTALMRARADKQSVTTQFAKVEARSRALTDGGLLTELESMIETGSRGIDQIGEIVVNLKNFSRLDRAKVSTFDVREGLQSTLVLARNLLKNRIEVIEEFDPVPSITCSPSQINQVFLNVITNAVQAMPEDQDGRLTLRTSQEGSNVVVEIQDNGRGIAPDILPKIFDPFFTTKEVGTGTGMGLSISYKIVRAHGGHIDVESEPDVGTLFRITLPETPPPDTTQAQAQAQTQQVNEDDDLVPA